MEATIDRSRYPHTAAYLDSLPRGLASYPECVAKAEMWSTTHRDLPVVTQLAGLPEPVRRLLGGGWREEWVPEVVGCAVTHVLVEAVMAGDEAAFFHFVDGVNEEVFRRPLYRALMLVLSTQLLVMGAAKRWGAMHQGTTLEAEKSVLDAEQRRLVRATLRFPPRLLDRLGVSTYGRAYLTAVRLTGAGEPRLALESMSETEAVFSLGWRAS